MRKKITISPPRCSTGQKYSLLLGIFMLFLCSAVSGQNYFKTPGGIPHIPVLAAAPTGITTGAVYFNSSNSNFYWYNGSSWVIVGGMVQATDVSFTTTGVCYTYSTYTASYSLTYSDNLSAATCPESGTTFQWYRATDASGTGAAAISGATSSSYTVISSDEGYYLSVGVKPQTDCGAKSIENFSPWVLAKLTAPDGTIIETLTSSTGRVWMDRNMGATSAATSSTDYEAYGSLFQWCRAADGHQLITWTSSSEGTAVNGTTSTLATDATNVGHSLFIIGNSSYSYDWLITQLANASLWWSGTAAGANNPCPTGYHVPTTAEWQSEITAGISNSSTAYSQLKITVAGFRSEIEGNTGGLVNTGSTGLFWASSGDYTNVIIESDNIRTSNNIRSYGCSVRCIQDE